MSDDAPQSEIGKRKSEHLDICVSDGYEVESGSTMLDEVRLIHRALPELNEAEIDTRTTFLGSPISMPLFISSMTGGSEEGFRRNKDLARVAQETGLPIGTGSIRVLFRTPQVLDHFRLKRIARDVPVFANIGGVQLRSRDNRQLIEILGELEADAVAVHLNPGQELAQPEGDRDFSGVLDGLHALCEESPVPVIVKETGFGIGPDEAAAMIRAGVTYVDVAGSGGTNWMTVEGYRLEPQARATVGEFAGWGIPTAVILRAIQSDASAFEGRVLASGGLRNGMHVAKCLAMGAVAGGMALPFIRAVSEGGIAAGITLVRQIEASLRTTMLLTGSRTVDELRRSALIVSPVLERYAEGLVAARRI